MKNGVFNALTKKLSFDMEFIENHPPETFTGRLDAGREPIANLLIVESIAGTVKVHPRWLANKTGQVKLAYGRYSASVNLFVSVLNLSCGSGAESFASCVSRRQILAQEYLLKSVMLESREQKTGLVPIFFVFAHRTLDSHPTNVNLGLYIIVYSSVNNEKLKTRYDTAFFVGR